MKVSSDLFESQIVGYSVHVINCICWCVDTLDKDSENQGHHGRAQESGEGVVGKCVAKDNI